MGEQIANLKARLAALPGYEANLEEELEALDEELVALDEECWDKEKLDDLQKSMERRTDLESEIWCLQAERGRLPEAIQNLEAEVDQLNLSNRKHARRLASDVQLAHPCSIFSWTGAAVMTVIFVGCYLAYLFTLTRKLKEVKPELPDRDLE